MLVRCCFVVAILIAQSISSASLNVDIAIVLHDSAQWLASPNELKAIDTTLRRDFATVFDLGDDKTRISIVATIPGNLPCSSEYGVWSVFTKLTGDKATLEKALDKIELCWVDVYLFKALAMVREQVFTGEAKKPRMILVFSIPEAERGMFSLENESKPLRDSGVLTFIIFEPLKDRSTTNHHYKELLKVAGSPSNIFNATNGFVTDLNEQLLRRIKTEMDRQVCRYEKRCFYADKARKKCEKASYTPSVHLSMVQAGADCNALALAPPVPISESCQSAECEEVCDDLWPWPKPEPDCGKVCGNTNVSRVGEQRWKNLEFCTRTYECPPCTGGPTESSKSTSTSPAAGPSKSTPAASTASSNGTSTAVASTQSTLDLVVDQPWFVGAMCLVVAVVLAIVAVVVIFVKV